MSAVHVVFQGKGGVGKSLVASFLAQYMLDHPERHGGVLAIDADPLNSGFARFPRCGAEVIDLLTNGAIDERTTNLLIDDIADFDGVVVIDTCPGLFIPLGDYLVQSPVVDRLARRGQAVLIHSVVVGGPAQGETLEGLAQTIRLMPPGVPIIVWLNDFFGPIVSPEGAPFEQMRIYRENTYRISGVIHLRQRDPILFGVDLRQMLERRQTFAEAIADPTLGIMVQRRLTMMRNELYKQLDIALSPG